MQPLVGMGVGRIRCISAAHMLAEPVETSGRALLLPRDQASSASLCVMGTDEMAMLRPAVLRQAQ